MRAHRAGEQCGSSPSAASGKTGSGPMPSTYADIRIAGRVGSKPLEPAEANLVFQVISKRYEKGSIILTSNKTFSKAHMSWRTCARWRRKSTGSSWRFRAADDCGGYQCYQVVGPAV